MVEFVVFGHRVTDLFTTEEGEFRQDDLENIYEFVREHQPPFLDGILHKSLIAVGAMFGVDKFDVNRWWCLTSITWICPGCKRNKSQIARLNKHGELTCYLVIHHDHMKSYIETRLGEYVGSLKAFHASPESEAFAKTLSDAVAAFDDVLVCPDCNAVDSVAKKLLGCPAVFSFTPRDIAHFVIAEPNRPHRIDPERLKEVWSFRQEQLRHRLALADEIVQIAATNKQWYEGATSDTRPKHVSSSAGNYLSRLTGYPRESVVEMYLAVACPKNEREPVLTKWRTKKAVKCERAPKEQELRYLATVTHRGQYASLSDEWRCPWCRRTKFKCIRPSAHHNFAFMVRDNKMLDAETSNAFRIVTCQDCSDIRAFVARDAEARVEAVYPEDVMAVIKPKPHSQHGIVPNDQVEAVVQRVSSRARVLGLLKGSPTRVRAKA